MSEKIFTNSQLPIRRTVDLLPQIFKTDTNAKFMAGAVDPLVQPGVLEKTVGYIGKRYGKTFKSTDIYLDSDETLRSRYQLEPGVVLRNNEKVTDFYDYLDFKNQLSFFGNNFERDDVITEQDHYSWNPPVEWDKLINYREYFWIPNGPPTVRVLGQAQGITSTYRVRLGDQNVWTFFPDGLTSNPTLTLYRGQTYVFSVNAPKNNFYIRTSFDQGMSSNWNKGVENNGTENGRITFTVPIDAPSLFYYQSEQEPDRFGQFLISDIESASMLNVVDEIIGKATYKSSNEVEFTNGLIVEFIGQTMPTKYQKGRWLVEGVGQSIALVDIDNQRVPKINIDVPEVFFDNAGFDVEPFDDASSFPKAKDYITINRSSIDSNPWSRYNRWFHRSVIEFSHKFSGTEVNLPEEARAKRPIIEFNANLQLFNHGARAKQEIDFIDTFTKDVFSNIEGSAGYNVDGEFLFDGARLLVTADTDSWVRNKIFRVTFITHNGRRQISLIEDEDSNPSKGDCVLVRRGRQSSGLMYHYTGSQWVESQKKNKVNQPPLFDAFDENSVSYSDVETYPVSSFQGTELLSYKLGNSVKDEELGIRLSYLNIDNVGDIVFEFDWEIDTFTWQDNQDLVEEKINNGYYQVNLSAGELYENGWVSTNTDVLQPVADAVTVKEPTSTIIFNAVEWAKDSQERIIFYLNGNIFLEKYTRVDFNKFEFDHQFKENDVITIKVYSDQDPDEGYYEIPLGLERNPLNTEFTSFTLGQALDHVGTMVELTEDFRGSFPGVGNLRDLAGYQANGRRFIKHSGITPVAITLLCDKDINIVRSIQFAKKSYTEFKNNFLKLASDLYINQDVPDFVDEIILELSKTKNQLDPFADSDMIGCGAYTKIDYEVEDEGINTFALSEKFDLNSLSRRAVYVYLNEEQLLVGKDYTFNSTFGFVSIIKALEEGDRIEIREYSSTAFCYIPPTPASMGMYKKYTPMMYLDDTYLTPAEVIQGHDGSIIVAYGDIRDPVLLELEKRIYNNIKKEYDENILNVDNLFGGYYGASTYGKDEFDSIVNTEFLKWASNTNINFVSNPFFDETNSFTYTYSNMSDPTRQQNLPGYWRGVYLWFYDTDRPHQRPWEMLGFSEQPDWWTSVYGPAPYTRGNLILWEDLENGIIRQGPRAGQFDRYKRPGLTRYIPVDGDGKLLSPLDSGLARDFSLINSRGEFKLGDVSPAEYSWRRSSELPYAAMLALVLLRPFETISKYLNLDQIYKNKLGQYLNRSTNTFFKVEDIILPTITGEQTCGLINWICNCTKSRDQDQGDIKEKLLIIDVNLSNRISGFVDQTQQRYLLDSKNPKSESSSIFIPQENYDIFFNVSVPSLTVSYSAVIIEKVNTGWRISGYDDINPFFRYYQAVPSTIDPVVAVGGVSDSFVDWTADKFYNNGQTVRHQNAFYRTITSHTSTDEFDQSKFRKLPGLPQVGAVQALKRKNFNKLRTVNLNYGTILTRIQDIVDFLLGYEQYLNSIGFIFDQYDPETQVNRDWFTSVKEFMFWTKHNWAEGSLLSLSPGADKLKMFIPVGAADNLFDTFYDYSVLKSDGTPLLPSFINVNRDIQEITVEKTNTTDGIYFIKLNFVLKEHVVVFSDRTVFNDVIYDKITGYRQDRIKVRGFRTTDWNGDYTSPGFIFDNVDITAWEPFTDYRLGDIVSYREFYWTSLETQQGVAEFDNTKWTRLDLIPKKGLVPNFDYKINQFEDYYDLDADGVGSSQRDLSRHGIGYQSRKYLENIAEDQVSQFKIYQGFIREKGTANSVTKIFDKLSRSGSDSISLKEEWAFRLGKFGGTDQIEEIEFLVNKSDFKVNPQPILVVESVSADTESDRFIKLNQASFTVPTLPYRTNINPVDRLELPGRSAGYVRRDQVDFVLKSKEDIVNLDIQSVEHGSYLWITFDNRDWEVLKYYISNTTIEAINDSVNPLTKDDDRVVIQLNSVHDIAEDEIIGIFGVENLTGFFKVIEVDDTTLTIEVPEDLSDPEIDIEKIYKIGRFKSVRYSSYSNIDEIIDISLSEPGAKFWIDQDEDKLWEVIEKSQQYSQLLVTDIGVPSPENSGAVLKYSDSLKQLIAPVLNQNVIAVYNASRPNLSPTQFIQPPNTIDISTIGGFGSSIALSADSRWLIVGSENASFIKSKFKGELVQGTSYQQDDIVLSNGNLWTALVDIDSDSSIDLDSGRWTRTTVIPHDPSGDPGFINQGMVTVYEWGSVNILVGDYNSNRAYQRTELVRFQGRIFIAIENVPVNNPPFLPTNTEYWTLASSRWNERATFVSPRAAANENFGHKVAIAKTANGYMMAASATGAVNNTGRVYLYKYTEQAGWNHYEVKEYAGLFETTNNYPAGSIVWYNNSLWKTVDGFVSDGSTTPENSELWIQLDDVATQNSLPTRPALLEELDFASAGLLTGEVEFIKADDRFGSSLAMSDNGEFLIVGAPDSDQQYFDNYKGKWESFQEYQTPSVVKRNGKYYKFDSEDSTLFSIDQDPELNPAVWEEIGVEDITESGKVFIYRRNAVGNYRLIQTLSADTLNDMSTVGGIQEGDKFGFSLAIDETGGTLIVSSPFADIPEQDRGAAYVFSFNFSENKYEFKQKLESYDVAPGENFGNSIAISRDSKTIIVGAQDYTLRVPVTDSEDEQNDYVFNRLDSSEFDEFSSVGKVYVFERKNGAYLLAEKLTPDVVQEDEGFGSSVDISGNSFAVGSPGFTVDEEPIGKIRLFIKSVDAQSLKIIAKQEPQVDIEFVKSIAAYDPVKNLKLADLDIVDHFKLKILGEAEQEITFKTPYDPATYIIGTDNQIVDADQAWFEKNVGKVWWDIRTAKWIWYEQGDVAYRSGNWNQLAEGASIDIYEWVESVLLPSEWADLSNTAEGVAEGITGTPLYPDDTVYNFKEIVNSTTGAVSETFYYYWVKNKTTLPTDPGRRISISDVRDLIVNPIGTGKSFLALIDKDKLLAYNFDSLIIDNAALINLQFNLEKINLNDIHSEYALISERDAVAKPPETLETKWIDSLVGFDSVGNQVPNPVLSAKQKYGVSFRPRQTMFVDREAALKITVEKINDILRTRPFTEIINFETLLSIDPEPDVALNLYDEAVDQLIDLQNVGTARLRPAILRPNIVDGEVDTIDIVDSGFGYKIAPPVDIQGDGRAAQAIARLDREGRIISVTVERRGRGYSTALIRIRNFSILVKNDRTANDFWSIYSWDRRARTFFRSKTQEFNTAKYWSYQDWWAEDYGVESRVIKEIPGLFAESSVELRIGELLKVKEFSNGGWAVLERTDHGTEIVGKYKIVGRENGTIQIKPEIYDKQLNNVGYDASGSYDSVPFDQQPITELRKILAAVKDDIFVEDLAVEWNRLFFTGINYIFSEQLYVDWAFKTSFLSAIHKVGDLDQKTNYKNDNLESFRDYLNEVKPYRTKIREYTSEYTELQLANTQVTDFDNPVYYSPASRKTERVTLDSELINSEPWKQWADNRGYSITDIEVYSQGEGYRSPPRVVIEGDAVEPAEARAFISSGRVSGIKVTNPGRGYLIAPKISLVGGNGDQRTAKAAAVLGAGKVRNFHLTMKFDRLSKTGIYSSLVHEETFIASGLTSVFELNYAPTRDKSKIAIIKNQELVLNGEYNIDLYRSEKDTYSLLKGKINFVVAPRAGDEIRVVYEKNSELFDAVSRIENAYKPTSGMLGFTRESLTVALAASAINTQIIEVESSKDIRVGMRVNGVGVVPCRVVAVSSKTHIVVSQIQNLSTGAVLTLSINNPNQLMTGIDFGGVQIQGNPFEVTGGWDALPWFTDTWDSVEASSDYFYVVNGSEWESSKRYSVGAIVTFNNVLYRATVPTTNSQPSPNSLVWEEFNYVELPVIPKENQLISVYLKMSDNDRAVRVDDPYFDIYDGSTIQPNGQVAAGEIAVMPSFIGDGDVRRIDLPDALLSQLSGGETLIFRTDDSDGTVRISDPNLIDTNLTGGTFETMRGAYTTAIGTLAEDIVVDGEKFISPDQVPAPEENVPGQVLDSVSIKVFHSKPSGAPTVLAKVFPYAAGTNIYNIGQPIIETTNVTIYANKQLLKFGEDYQIDFVNSKIGLVTPLTSGDIVEIISIGIGGISILDYQEFVSDGKTRLFLTNANFNLTRSVVTTVNGVFTESVFSNSRDSVNNVDRTLVEIAIPPKAGESVKIISLGAILATEVNPEPAVRVNQQTFIVDGSTRSYQLDKFVDAGRSSARGSILVQLNGTYLKSSDTVYFKYDGTNNIVNLGQEPFIPPGSISINDIRVFKNEQLLRYIEDWTFIGAINQLTILASKLAVNDLVRVEQNILTDYNIVDGNLILDHELEINEGDELEVTWFNEYPTVSLVKEVFDGGKLTYPLSRKPVAVSYVWVFEDGRRLTPDVDYYLIADKNLIKMVKTNSDATLVEIVQFGNDIYRETAAYEIFKDMLNVNHFKRFSLDSAELTKTLNYFDTEILINDASKLPNPNPRLRLPGTISINGERIDYYSKNGNTLGQLRRGVFGTPIAETHPKGSRVADVSVTESLPYQDQQDKYDFISDGLGLEIGPLEFVPRKSEVDFYKITAVVTENGESNIVYPSIPEIYGRCDELEVFVGGRRLSKSSYEVYNEDVAASSPDADFTKEADFAVDGETPFIRLTEPVPAGIRITVLRRTGKTWYDPGENTATSGVTLFENNSVITRFIAGKSTKLP
jgi:hypothetical protein